jgi:type IV secretion system protein VirD4
LPPPSLSEDGAADALPARSHDWVGLASEGVLAADGSASLAGGEGLQQARQPALPSRRRRKAPEAEQPELPGLGEDEADGSVAGFAGALRPLAPGIAAHAVNEGSGPGGDLMPSF